MWISLGDNLVRSDLWQLWVCSNHVLSVFNCFFARDLSFSLSLSPTNLQLNPFDKKILWALQFTGFKCIIKLISYKKFCHQIKIYKIWILLTLKIDWHFLLNLANKVFDCQKKKKFKFKLHLNLKPNILGYDNEK